MRQEKHKVAIFFLLFFSQFTEMVQVTLCLCKTYLFSFSFCTMNDEQILAQRLQKIDRQFNFHQHLAEKKKHIHKLFSQLKLCRGTFKKDCVNLNFKIIMNRGPVGNNGKSSQSSLTRIVFLIKATKTILLLYYGSVVVHHNQLHEWSIEL